jgi:PAS domain S-box-containing protein
MRGDLSRLGRSPKRSPLPSSERPASDDPILKREEWLRLAAQSAHIGLWYWNEPAWDLFWDAKSRDIFGVNQEGTILLDAFYEALHVDDVDSVRKVWRYKLKHGLPYELEYRTKYHDGSIRWVHARGRGYYGKDGIPLRMVGVHVDITERKKVEQERLDLSGRLINAQEQERARLARELHDDFSQRLALLSLEMGSIAKATNDPLARSRLSELKGELQSIGVDLHTLSHRLHSSKLDLLGLVITVRSFCAEFAERHGLRIDFDHKGIPTSIPPDTALALYRIVQEALRNVIKHSLALSAKVRLTADPEAISLTVSDNGIGFDVSKSHPSNGIGIQSMKERARMIGGICEVRSRPVQGTQIVVKVPLKSARTGA